MNTKFISSALIRFFVLLSLLLGVSYYMAYSARITYMQAVDIGRFLSPTGYLGALATPQYWLELFKSLFGISSFSFAFIAIGKFATKPVNFIAANTNSTISQLATLGTYYLIGLIVYSVVFLVLGGFFQITWINVLAFLCAGILAGVFQIKSIGREFIFSHIELGQRERFFLRVVILLLGLTLLTTAARISYDSTAIYFSDAKISAYRQHITYFSDDIFTASVFQNVIQYTAIILLFGDQAARMLSWMCGLVVIIFSLGIAEQVGISKRGYVFLLIMLLTSTAFVDLLGDGKVDLICTALAMAAIYWLNGLEQTRTEGAAGGLLIGLFAGMAITGRPFNAFLLGIFVLLFHISKYGGSRRGSNVSIKSMIASLFWIGVGVIITGLFHLYTNWMIEGDPFAFRNSLTSINPATGPWDNDPQIVLWLRLLYPLMAVFRNTPQSLGNISPLVIIFLPALLWKGVRARLSLSPNLVRLVAISAITLTLWIFLFFTIVELRYVMFLWIILFLPASELIVAFLEEVDPFLQKLSIGVLLVLISYFILRTGIISIQTHSPLDTKGDPQCSGYTLCDYLEPINQVSPTGARILTLSAYRYYLRNDLFVCSTKAEEYSKLQTFTENDSEAFWEYIYQMGYTFIAYEYDYTNRHLQLNINPSPDNAPSWLKLERIDDVTADYVSAYKINVTEPPTAIQYECRVNENGIWDVVPLK
ncbi:MAG: hypothetical protein JNK32_05810 [Anaerolineales bacterium]|nr:hypothetical protein [Anaerolineales bacterium]